MNRPGWRENNADLKRDRVGHENSRGKPWLVRRATWEGLRIIRESLTARRQFGRLVLRRRRERLGRKGPGKN